MSLGGIAIAIGAMIDAAIIMVENAHKALESFKEERGREPTNKERIVVLIEAAKSTLFLSSAVRQIIWQTAMKRCHVENYLVYIFAALSLS
jgi:Cu/Ag efflux pump CusA